MAKRIATGDGKTADNPRAAPGSNSQTVAVAKLRAALERVERLTEEKKAIADDIKDVYLELKSQGFDTAAMREIVKVRAMGEDALGKYREKRSMIDLYAEALGVNIGDPHFTGEADKTV